MRWMATALFVAAACEYAAGQQDRKADPIKEQIAAKLRTLRAAVMAVAGLLQPVGFADGLADELPNGLTLHQTQPSLLLQFGISAQAAEARPDKMCDAEVRSFQCGHTREGAGQRAAIEWFGNGVGR